MSVAYLGQVEGPAQQVLLLQAAVHVGRGLDDALNGEFDMSI